jgi:hypothetical protein
MRWKSAVSVGAVCVILSFLLLSGCEIRTKEGPAAYQWQMKVEHDYQMGYSVQHFYKLEANVKGAFKAVGTELTLFPDSCFEFDSLLELNELQSFFQRKKSTALEYYLMSADGLKENQGGGEKFWGVTKWSFPNVPPSPAWSFVFVGDIDEEYYGGTYTKHRTVAYTTIHELGHQRAGLTDADEYGVYHKPTYGCAMYTHDYVLDPQLGVLNTMGFCWDNTYGDNCKYFLQQVNSKKGVGR